MDRRRLRANVESHPTTNLAALTGASSNLVVVDVDGEMRGEPSSEGFAFENLTVQRASRSFCASFAGLSFQASGMRPALISAFSASVLRSHGQDQVKWMHQGDIGKPPVFASIQGPSPIA